MDCMYESYFTVLDTCMCLRTNLKSLNSFCEFMWSDFLYKKKDHIVITVVPGSQKKCYSIYHNNNIAIDYGRELTDEPYDRLSKVLENIILGYPIIKHNNEKYIPFHSGAVNIHGEGVLIFGEGGDGKSTLVLNLIDNHNALYFSDEVGLVDHKNNIHPFLKTISYNPKVSMSSNDWARKSYFDEHHIAVPKLIQADVVQLKRIVFVKYDKYFDPVVTKVNKSECIHRLFNSQIGMSRSYKTVDIMARIVNNTVSYQLRHNDAEKASLLLIKSIESCGDVRSL